MNEDSIHNLSDHLPIVSHLNCNVEFVTATKPIFILKTLWYHTDDIRAHRDHLILYQYDIIINNDFIRSTKKVLLKGNSYTCSSISVQAFIAESIKQSYPDEPINILLLETDPYSGIACGLLMINLNQDRFQIS